MPTRRISGLVLLNAAMLGLLALLTLAPGAGAQQRRRPVGQYAMVDLKYQGSPEAAVVLLDASNRELVALKWDRSRKVLIPLGFRDLVTDGDLRQKGGR